MGKNSLVTTSPAPTSKQLDLLIREWLVTLAEVFPCQLTPKIFSIWAAALSDVPVEAVGKGFNKLLKTWKPEYGRTFPVPADLRSLLDKTAKLKQEEAAELSWQATREIIQNRYHPDLGWRGPRIEDELISNSVRAAGGAHYITQCTEGELVWAKKRFIECYLRGVQLGTERPSLSPELRATLAPLATIKTLK